MVRARELVSPNYLLRHLGRAELARLLVWIGLLTPVAVNEVRTRAGVLNSLLDPIALLKGGVPLACLVLAWLIHRRRLLPFTRLEGLLSIYLSFVLVSTIWSAFPAATVLKGANLLTLYALVLTLARLHEEDHADSIVKMLPILYALLVCSLIWLAISPHAAYQAIGIYEATKRLMGVFPAAHPDALALVAATAIVGALARVGPPWAKQSFAAMALSGVFLVELLLTKTRSALIVLLVGVLVLSARVWRLRTTLALIVISGVFALVIATGSLPLKNLLGRSQSPLAFSTLTGRTLTWSDALVQWKQRPLIGFGYYAGHRLALKLHPGAPEVDTVDNMWVETLIDLGLVGTLPLSALVAYAGYTLFFRPIPDSSPTRRALRQSLFVVCFVASAINASLETAGYLMIIFSLVIFGAPRICTRHEQPASAVDRPYK